MARRDGIITLEEGWAAMMVRRGQGPGVLGPAPAFPSSDAGLSLHASRVPSMQEGLTKLEKVLEHKEEVGEAGGA